MVDHFDVCSGSLPAKRLATGAVTMVKPPEVEPDLQGNYSRGMVVEFTQEGVQQRGWIECAFVDTGEYWLRAESTGGLVVRAGSDDPVGFRFADFRATGDWACGCALDRIVQLSGEEVDSCGVSVEGWADMWAERFGVEASLENDDERSDSLTVRFSGAALSVNNAVAALQAEVVEYLVQPVIRQDVATPNQQRDNVIAAPPLGATAGVVVRRVGELPSLEQGYSAPFIQGYKDATSAKEKTRHARVRELADMLKSGELTKLHRKRQFRAQAAECASREAAMIKAQEGEKVAAMSVGRNSKTRDRVDSAGAKKSIDDWAKDQSQFADFPPLPSGWIRARSNHDESIYFVNISSGETSTEMPNDTSPDDWIVKQSRSSGTVYYYNKTNGKSQFTNPLT